MVFYTFNFGFTMQPCRNQEREGGAGAGGLQPHTQIFANFYFLWIEKKVLKWKIKQNYKTS